MFYRNDFLGPSSDPKRMGASFTIFGLKGFIGIVMSRPKSHGEANESLGEQAVAGAGRNIGTFFSRARSKADPRPFVFARVYGVPVQAFGMKGLIGVVVGHRK